MLLEAGGQSQDHLERVVVRRIFFKAEYATVIPIPHDASEPTEASQNVHPDARHVCTVRVRCGRVVRICRVGGLTDRNLGDNREIFG